MNLVFEKKDSQTIIVKINHEGKIQDFDYITMLKGLLNCGSLEDSELTGDFTDAERTSIDSMVKHLNDCVPAKDGQEDWEGDSEEDTINPKIAVEP